ncbi:MAG TPA: Ig-like domain-containing protein, partial [bacterium]
ALNVPVNAVFVDSGNGAGLFVFTPDFSQSDIYDVTFKVADTLGGVDSEVVQITVSNVNRSPVLASIGSKTVDEAQTLQFRISGTDPDGDSVHFSAVNVPTNATFVDSGNGAGSFTFNPNYDQAGPYSVTFIASDGSLADSEAVSITVNDVNRAPVLSSIGPRSVIEGGHMAFLISASDPDGDSLVLNTQNLPNHSSFTDSGNGKGSFTFDPDYTQSGLHYVTFKVSDLSLVDSEVVQITVIEAGNQAPVLDSIGPKNLAEADTLRFRVHASDPDGNNPALFVRNNPANSSFVDSGNGAGSLTFTPNYDQAGIYMVSFVATDGVVQDSERVQITVAQTNRPPVLDSIGPRALNEGDTMIFRVHASDPDNDPLVLSVDSLPAQASFVDSGNGACSFKFTPDFTQSGIYSLTFKAFDGALADSEVVTITVNEAGNHAPILSSIGVKSVDEGGSLSFRISASDLDFDSLILSAENLPANSVLVDSGNGAGSFVFDPDYTQADLYNVVFIASDGSLADSETVPITVNNVDLPPVLDSIGPQTVQESETLVIRISASDPDGDLVALSVKNIPANTVFTDSGNGAGSFIFTPDFTQSGVYYVTFTASSAALMDSEVVQITVTEFGNNAPVLDSIGPKAVVEGGNLEFR